MELSTGGHVAGIIQEECAALTEMEPGVSVAAAQLVLNEYTVRWRRAGRAWPRNTRETAPTILNHLLVGGGDNSFLVRLPGSGQRLLVRDYSEVDDPSVQDPYDAAVRG